MPEAVIRIYFKGHDTMRHQMNSGTKEEAVAIARETHETYKRLLRTGIGSIDNIDVTIDVYINDQRVVHFA